MSKYRKAMFNLVNGLLFHSTSEMALRGIFKDQLIKPYSGDLKEAWPLTAGRTTYARKNNYVCLFDFENVPAKKLLTSCTSWYRVMTTHSPFNIFLVLDRELIKEKMIANETAVIETNYALKFIPIVEVWHSEAIPAAAIKYILISQNFMTDTNLEPRQITFDRHVFEKISQYKNDVVDKYATEYEDYVEQRKKIAELEKITA